MSKKKCFIIMPISDADGYPSNHFERVFEYIIKPACINADFYPIRADDILSTNYIAIDILKHIIDCDMAICDLSSKNPNVLFELGIRQAFNKPVTLIKDYKTNRIFDIQGIRDIEYDENLRIDNVNETIKILTETLKNTFENTEEINSLISVLGIEPAKVKNKKISHDTELILNSLKALENRILDVEKTVGFSNPYSFKYEDIAAPETKSQIGPLYGPLELKNITHGTKVYHSRFGYGDVFQTYNDKIEIMFNGEVRRFIINFAKLYKVKSFS